MPNLFKDILPSIMQTKKSVLNTEEDYKEYNPYIINRALSKHKDCIMYANEANIYNGMDKDMHYQYMMNSIRGKKRPFEKWEKFEKNTDIDMIKEYFSISSEKARDYLRILTEEQLIEFREWTHKGGVTK